MRFPAKVGAGNEIDNLVLSSALSLCPKGASGANSIPMETDIDHGPETFITTGSSQTPFIPAERWQ